MTSSPGGSLEHDPISLLLQVNGHVVQLPARPSATVSVKLAQDKVTVAQGKALRVQLSRGGDVRVVASGHLARKLSGACGSFNGNRADDLRLPDGTVAHSVSELVGYWRFTETVVHGTAPT